MPSPKPNKPLDLLVIGGGFGGLATAALARAQGLEVALLEAHTKLGGCAGYFDRGPFTFDAGATALMGTSRGEPIGDLLALLGIDDFKPEPTPSYRVHLPDRSLDIVSDPALFEAHAATAFPTLKASRQQAFWRFQAWAGNTLFEAASKVPRLPARAPADLLHDLRVLGLSGLLAASTSLLTVDHVLRLFGLKHDVPFRSLIAMLLQDTAQTGPDTVPFANAAACLQAYRRGMSRPRGGMKALAQGIGHRFASLGGDLRTATLVDKVEALPDNQGFLVTTRRRHHHQFKARQVAFNLPIDLAARLLGRSLEGRLARREAQSRASWSACTAYLAFPKERAPEENGPLFHQVLQHYDRPIHDGNNVLVSLSPLDDEAYAPLDQRVATLSTHTRAEAWENLDRPTYEMRKAAYQERLLAAFRKALPEAADHLTHAEFATPRSFQRYTRRTLGRVGGPPVSRRNSNFLAVGSDALGKNLWLVGDSAFPGQGTMAVVLCAIRLVERITGTPWSTLRSQKRPSAPLESSLTLTREDKLATGT